jgi:hypothetical protein
MILSLQNVRSYIYTHCPQENFGWVLVMIGIFGKENAAPCLEYLIFLYVLGHLIDLLFVISFIYKLYQYIQHVV